MIILMCVNINEIMCNNINDNIINDNIIINVYVMK